MGMGVREYVVCAGARNLSLVEALLGSDEAIVWSHFEERSAGFFALGRTIDSREPCAVVTTSGTAVAELLPAVIEAYYQGRPLVLITADRPAEFRGSGAPQAIEQSSMFSTYVEFSHDIGVADLLVSIAEMDERYGEGQYMPTPCFCVIQGGWQAEAYRQRQAGGQEPAHEQVRALHAPQCAGARLAASIGLRSCIGRVRGTGRRRGALPYLV